MRRHKGSDGWGRDSYGIPEYAVIGASDCGSWSDSPAPSDSVASELERFRKDALRPAGIRSRVRYTQSGNLFMAKRWITVSKDDFKRAWVIADDWLAAHNNDTRYAHDAR